MNTFIHHEGSTYIQYSKIKKIWILALIFLEHGVECC